MEKQMTQALERRDDILISNGPLSISIMSTMIEVASLVESNSKE